MRLALFALAVSSAAVASRPFTPEELLQTRRLDDVQVSPDGKWASVTVRQKSLAENRDVKDVWLIPLGGGPARQFTRDGRSEHARWSPDGKSILIVRESQLWLFDLADGGDPIRLTSLSGGADTGTWSPDGRLIAFTSDVFPECSTTAAAAAAGSQDACNRAREEERAKTQVKARISDHLFTRHWSDWKDGKRTHVFALALNGTPRDLTPRDGDWPTFRVGGADDLSISPDGAEVAISHKPAEKEAWSTNSDLFVVPADGRSPQGAAFGVGGAPRNLTASNPGDDAQPRYSPDGRYLAWLAQAREGYESDQWKLKLLDRKSGKVAVIGDFDDDVGGFVWRRDSKGLVGSVVKAGRYYLNTVSLDGKVARFTDSPSGADFDLAPDGAAAVIVSGMNRPPELYRVGPGGQPQRLSHFNDEQYKDLDLGPPPEDLWVASKDGTRIHSFVLRPPGLAKGKAAPLTVLIHGGPQGSWEDSWGMRWNEAAFAARGHIVVAIDPHGSIGYGQKFKEEISRDWGGLAYDDILRAVDAAEQRPDVERGRTCAAGASFGGYMIDWIAGHTDRFKCLVTHDGVFDLASEYGSTEELWFPEWEFGGAYWENPELYRKFSPSSYVQSFRTPTLVVQGELDYRVPVEQGMGMFTALQRRGVESRLLYFPDEGHWVTKPRNSQLWYHTVLDWIDAHAALGSAHSAPAGNHATPPAPASAHGRAQTSRGRRRASPQ